MKKKMLSIMLCAAMAVTMLAGCGSSTPNTATDAAETDAQTAEAPDETQAAETQTTSGDSSGVIGVVMPTKDLQRWNQDGENMKAQLEAAGYTVDLQFSNDDVNTQIGQIETMVAANVSILVIASINGESLGVPLSQAKEAGIPVIAYDRLLMNSDAVTYYATFDNYMVGTKQGEYIESALDLANAEGPFNLEIFAGDPGDNNATYFYNGAMDVLKPYVDEGKLVVKSGSEDFADVAIAGWSTETAQSRMEAVIASYYADGTVLDAVLCSNDSTSLGVQNALDASYTGEWPVITGQDCDIANVKNMIAGKQSMSVFKDTRTLASKTVEMVDAILKGGEAPVNDTSSYDNGTGIIPTYLCEPVFADVDNYTELLIDSGYYTEADLQ